MKGKGLNRQKTRNLERSRREILKVAFQKVFRRGFQGVSIDDIVKGTSLTKGAFYHHFPTKLDLGYALVDEVIRPMIAERWIKPLENHEDPLECVLAQMKQLMGGQLLELKLGCPLNNLVQEMAPIDPGFKRRLRSALEFWVDEMEQHLRAAKNKGILRSEVNTRQLAHFIVMAHEGFYGLLKGLDTPRAFETLLQSLRSYFVTLKT